MTGLPHPDSARAKRVERRRLDDLAFLEKVRATKTMDDVRALRRAQGVPICEWRHVSLMRAMRRVMLSATERTEKP